jgi:general secretion pathway protein L
MGTLIIQMPSRAAADQVEHWIELPCAYAYPTPESGVQSEGIKSLSALAPEISAAGRLVMLIAASDVTVLRVKVPPLSQAQLQRALPSLVEDRLLTEPAECVIVSGPIESGWCTVAVVQRIWLELLSRTVNAYGASAVVALPTQLCVQYEKNATVAALTEDEREIVFRVEQYEGFGLPIGLAMTKNREALAKHVMEVVSSMSGGRQVMLHVPPRCLPVFIAARNQAAEKFPQVTPLSNGWAHMIRSIGQVEMNLLTGAANAARVHRRDWRSFRFVWALVLLAVLINIVGLNAEWLSLRREADSLRAGMMQTYRAAFPNEKTIVDPLLQMRRHLADASRNAGNPGADDFLALLARFGTAWSTARPGSLVAPVIAKLEYREHNLVVTLQPGNSQTMESVRSNASGLRLTVVQTGADMWQIRNAP